MNHIEMMRLAEKVALKSVCKRAQVGAVVRYTSYKGCVGNPWTTATGYNMRPCGGVCEGADGRTLPDILHAEDVAIQTALDAVECEDLPDGVDDGGMFDSALYVTRQPCIKCARLIVDAGIHAVYYRDADDKVDGIEHLLAHGVAVNSGWLKEQMRAQTLERVQDKWADRWQGEHRVGDVVNVLGVDLRVIEVFEPHPSNLMPWLCDADKACDACPQKGDGVCCRGVR